MMSAGVPTHHPRLPLRHCPLDAGQEAVHGEADQEVAQGSQGGGVLLCQRVGLGAEQHHSAKVRHLSRRPAGL